MEQTQEKLWKITENRALLNEKSFEGRSLLSAVNNMEMFFDFLEDIYIYKKVAPVQQETICENSNKHVIERDFQEYKYLKFEILKDAIELVWYQIEDEDGDVWGKSTIDPKQKEFCIAYMAADEQTQEQIKNLLTQDAI